MNSFLRSCSRGGRPRPDTARQPAGRHRTTGFRICAAVLAFLPGTLSAQARLPVGERAVYSIHWGPFTCGTSTFECTAVEHEGKPMIRIRVRAKSNWLVSTVYPVDDTVDCYIDPETGLSVRVEKDTSEGGKVCRDTLVIDRENNMARWTSESDNITTNYPIEAGACDAVSFLYEFRRHSFEKTTSIDFNIVVDAVLHGITIRAGEHDTKKVDGIGKINCRKYTVAAKREDLFVRKIPQALWLSDDERRILVRMDLLVPVGRARILLQAYEPPHP